MHFKYSGLSSWRFNWSVNDEPTAMHEDWESLIFRKRFLKLNIAAISRLAHRRLFLTPEIHLHEIIDEHEEIQPRSQGLSS